VSAYPEPRRIVLTLADLRRMTVLERARVCVIAGISEAEIRGLLATMTGGKGSPEDLERGVLLLYACAWQLERRRDPELSWETAQAWDLALDLETADPLEDAEARASVDAARATGLPPREAGALTLAQVEAYAEGSAETRRRPRRARR